MILGEPPRSGEIAERRERLRVMDAPGGEPRVADAELVPAVGGYEQVGVGVGVAVLGEPQAGAAFEQHRGGEGTGGRVAEQSGGSEGGVRVVEFAELGQRVDEGEEAPDHGGRQAIGELEVKGETSVGLGVADLAGVCEGDRAQEAAVGEHDSPPARAREIDQGGALLADGV